jgi:hypothetical protein
MPSIVGAIEHEAMALSHIAMAKQPATAPMSQPALATKQNRYAALDRCERSQMMLMTTGLQRRTQRH